MALSGVFDFLTRRNAEADPDFRRELSDYARRGLVVIGCVEIGMTLISALQKALHFSQLPDGPFTWWPNVAFAALGLAAFAFARFAPPRHLRPLGIVLGLLSVLFILGADIGLTRGAIGDKLMLNVVTVMLVAVATLPLTPLLSIGLNTFAVGCFMAAWDIAGAAGYPVPDTGGTIMLSVLAGVCVFLSTVNYGRLHSAWESHRDALRASDELRQSELRACTAENAMSHVRLAAALSHEFNTPLGALKSAVQTVSSAAERIDSVPPERRARLAQAIEQAAHVANDAADRMSTVVRRIQRFSNLDGADLQDVDVESMIRDIIALHEGSETPARVATDFAGVSRFRCQPQALSAAFATILLKALDASSPDGTVQVRTFESATAIITRIDHGRAAAMPVDFQLGFAVDRDRVSAANWDLFNARQAIRALGGEIEADGTTAINVLLTRR